MLLTLAHLRARYGSAERYVVEHLGLSEDVVARIRQNLIVSVQEDVSSQQGGEKVTMSSVLPN